ncbi:MAG: iron-sulfur cluster biosynthesis family protein [Candidatus Kariarchaeaceae archaeon]|jgi:Fe-S cluster assembly iron-binding protein IscA
MINLGTVDTIIEATKEAKIEIRRQLQLHTNPEAGVRIHVVIDRYSGYIFDLEFDVEKENDFKVTLDGIQFFTDKMYLDYITGMKIDFDAEVPTFLFKNENPSYNCVPGAKFECPSCNLYDERKNDPAYSSLLHS